MSPTIEAERSHRMALWEQLRANGHAEVKPVLLNKLKVFYGGRGIWVDKARTAGIGGNDKGVTVGLLHTGSSYADDLSDEGVLYHYPITKRPGRDKAEVDATKVASEMNLPVFVIVHPWPKASSRRVHLGWIEKWDDHLGLFFVSFGEVPPAVHSSLIEPPFPTITPKRRKIRPIKDRPNQIRFKFEVLQRYGAACAVCGLEVLDLLEAAHIIPDENDGPDDPRNGLVFCRNHHRAFDRGLFIIEPESLNINSCATYELADHLQITRTNLNHLKYKPHPFAVRWRWQHYSAQTEAYLSDANAHPTNGHYPHPGPI
jgi:hypothetical protein